MEAANRHSATFGQTWQVVEYYDTDAIGSIRAVTDAAGADVARHDFLPFGEELSPQTPPYDKRLYTGQERDVETGQDYFGARYYRADIGRFTAVDPLLTIEENLVDSQRWNRYVYARNSPLKYIDSDGRDWRMAPGLSGADLDFIRAAIAEAIRHPQARADFLALEGDSRVIELRTVPLPRTVTAVTSYPAVVGTRVYDTVVTFDVRKIQTTHFDPTGVVTFDHELLHVSEGLNPSVSFAQWTTGDDPLFGPGTLRRLIDIE